MTTASLADKREVPVLSRRQVEGLIAEGRKIIIYEQQVLKLDAWIPYHPGGDKVIYHVVGRDATNEINIYHSENTLRMIERFQIGKIDGRWRNFLPPIQGGHFRPLDEGGEDEEQEQGANQGQKNELSSQALSRSPSLVFDTSDADASLRKRHASNLTCVSDVPLADPIEEPFDGMAHLDVITKMEIKLDREKYPSLDPDTQEDIGLKFRQLHERIKAEGLYHCNYKAYGIEIMRYLLLLACWVTFLRLGWYMTSAGFLGFWWHQLMFTAHDSAHISITHDFQVDSLIGLFITDFLGGLSVGWWKRNHNVHHIVTNMPEHDPDIEYIPLFALSHRFLKSLRSTYYERALEYDGLARFLVTIQHKTFYWILLFGRFNLYRLSWEYLLFDMGPHKGVARWHRSLEFLGNVFFWFWFGYLVLYKSVNTNWHRFLFVLVSHVVTSPIHLQITLSHFAMSSADLGANESFPQRQLRTTMDVDCPEWLDFLHGGLQFQVIHHLFPRLPRHNLRRAQKLVQEFCNEVGIPYALYGFVEGNKTVVGRLADVAQQAAILNKCHRVMAKHGDLGLY